MTGPLTIEDVKDLIATVEETERNLHRANQRLREHGDTMLLATRPSYPTPEQIAGIQEAGRRIHAQVPPNSHHGDPCGPPEAPYIVAVDGRGSGKGLGWLSVRVGAPYRLTRRGERLWDFTDAEVEAILAVVQDQGLTVANHWRADNGVSIVTTNTAKENTDD